MNNSYENNSNILKVLSDPNRIRIVDMLSCGERCACDILKKFDFTQPTLSHHMKVLSDSGIVKTREEGLWRYYSLNKKTCAELVDFLGTLVSEKKDCICEIDKNTNIKCK